MGGSLTSQLPLASSLCGTPPWHVCTPPQCHGSLQPPWPHAGLGSPFAGVARASLPCVLLWGFLTVWGACGDLSTRPHVVQVPRGLGAGDEQLPILTPEQALVRRFELSPKDGPVGRTPGHSRVASWAHVPAPIPVPQPCSLGPRSCGGGLCLSLCFWGTRVTRLTFVLFGFPVEVLEQIQRERESKDPSHHHHPEATPYVPRPVSPTA